MKIITNTTDSAAPYLPSEILGSETDIMMGWVHLMKKKFEYPIFYRPYGSQYILCMADNAVNLYGIWCTKANTGLEIEVVELLGLCKLPLIRLQPDHLYDPTSPAYCNEANIESSVKAHAQSLLGEMMKSPELCRKPASELVIKALQISTEFVNHYETLSTMYKT